MSDLYTKKVIFDPKKVIFDPKKVIFEKIKKNRGTEIAKKNRGVMLNIFFFKTEKTSGGAKIAKKNFFRGVTLNKTFFFKPNRRIKNGHRILYGFLFNKKW